MPTVGGCGKIYKLKFDKLCVLLNNDTFRKVISHILVNKLTVQTDGQTDRWKTDYNIHTRAIRFSSGKAERSSSKLT